MGVCIWVLFCFRYFFFWILSAEIKYSVQLHSVLCFDIISLKNEVGPVGNRHVRITLHVISMLHIHT